MWLNLPLISWLWLRGKCAECKVSIPFRYFGVELLTAILFAVVAWQYAPLSPLVVLFLWALMAILVSITFIDAEHLIIPTSMTWAGSGLGLVACMVWPQLPNLHGDAGNWLNGLMLGGIGWVLGYFGLWAVVLLGKAAFGKKAMKFNEPVKWFLKEPQNDTDPMYFVIDEEEVAWWDIFFRKTDRLIVDATSIRVSGEPVGEGKLTIREDDIVLPDGTVHKLSDITSLDGTATATVIPREAMGMGDIHLLAMIGAFFGWGGVFFAIFSASMFALLAALVGRIGFGKQLPFGPFLAMGAVTWMFGGWKLWQWYFDLLGPVYPYSL